MKNAINCACPYLKFHLGIHEEGIMNVSYDPTVGFTLDPINVMHAGLYECKAVLGEAEEYLHIHLDVLSMYKIFYRTSLQFRFGILS
jgi:hypothetical protein